MSLSWVRQRNCSLRLSEREEQGGTRSETPLKWRKTRHGAVTKRVFLLFFAFFFLSDGFASQTIRYVAFAKAMSVQKCCCFAYESECVSVRMYTVPEMCTCSSLVHTPWQLNKLGNFSPRHTRFGSLAIPALNGERAGIITVGQLHTGVQTSNGQIQRRQRQTLAKTTTPMGAEARRPPSVSDFAIISLNNRVNAIDLRFVIGPLRAWSDSYLRRYSSQPCQVLSLSGHCENVSIHPGKPCNVASWNGSRPLFLFLFYIAWW